MFDLASVDFFAWNPFRMMHCRPATPEERKPGAPLQAQQLTIISRMAGKLHTFSVAEDFRIPHSDMGISSLLSALTSTVCPHEPRHREQQRRRRPVAA